jgi:hypothetical protein
VWLAGTGFEVVESDLAEAPITRDPTHDGLIGHVEFLGDEGIREALFEVHFDGAEFEIQREAPAGFSRKTPRGFVLPFLGY